MNTPLNNKRAFEFLRPYVRPYYGDLGWMTLFYLFQHAYVWLSPIIIGLLIDLTAMDDLSNRYHLFWWYGGALLLMLLWNPPSSLARTFFQSKMTRGISQDLRVNICTHLQQLSLLFHGRQSIGKLHSKALRDIETIEQLPRQFIWLFLSTVISILVALITIAIRVPQALVFFATLIPVSVILQRYFDKRMESYAKSYRESFEEMSAGISDMMNMVPVTRAHGLEQFEISRMKARITEVFQQGRKLDMYMEIFGAGGWVTFTFLQTIFTLGSVWFCMKGHLRVGDVVIFHSFCASISWSLLGLVHVVPILSQARDAMFSIGELMNAPDREVYLGRDGVDSIHGRFEFVDITYQYPSTTHHAVQALSLTVTAGESVAFVGPSGAGKSTMLALILGFLRPQSGCIKLDGQDIHELDLRQVRQHIGVVTQDIVFFSGTIHENVAFGQPDISEERVWASLDQANARAFVEQLPDQIKTKLGENGITLSGGQQQRLAIARALIRDPKILILDEATSALDLEAEALIQETLAQVMNNRTTFVVAHRLSTVRLCNRIVILENGAITEVGSHAELLRSDNFYSRAVKAFG